MLIDPLLATGLIFLSVVAPRTLPRRLTRLKLALTIVLFAALSVILFRDLGSPLNPKFDQYSPSIEFWQRLIAAAWWILGARTLLAVGKAIVLVGGGSRETKLVSDLISGGVYLTAILFIIKIVFAVPIGGLVATSGVIAIVLGLALQNTLADVFSGIAVGIEGPVSVGDRIWLDGPLEGEIVQINWRSLRIRTDGNDIAIVPHSIVAKSRIINRSYPTERRSDAIDVTCDSAVAPTHVIPILHRTFLLCPAILKDPSPSIALTDLGGRKNTYQIAFSVTNSNLLGDARNQLLSEIARHFRYEGLRFTGTDVARAKESAHIEDAIDNTRYSPSQILDDLPLLRDLSPKQRLDLSKKMLRRFLEAQDILFSQGTVDASLFIIASGVMEISRETAERKIILGRIGPGDYIGEIGLLTGVPHAATVKALTPCIAYELHKDDIAPLLLTDPDLASAFEASARRGQEQLTRAAAASASAHADSAGPLLARIRAFFNLPR